MSRIREDLYFALRILRKNKGMTLAALLTLALGIGSTTAIFSVVSAVLFRPLPWPEPDRLVAIWQATEDMPEVSVNRLDFADWQDQAKLFSSMAIFRGTNLNLTGTEEPERLRGLEVSSGIFATLGVEPALGRGFTKEEDGPGAQLVTLLSHGLWQERFGGDPKILGQTLRLNGLTYQIVGVLPAAIEGEVLKWWSMGDLWVPFGTTLDQLPAQRGYSAGHLALGRIRPGVDFEAAQQELSAIAQRLAVEYPDSNAGKNIALATVREEEVGEIRPALLTALAAIAFVLFIGCANVANLQLARAAARSREISIRAALGAGRRRLVRQLLTESTLLALLGGGLGTLGAIWGVKWMAATLPTDGSIASGDIRLNAWALVFALGVSLLAGLLFGLLPALHACRPNLAESLTAGGGRSASHGRQRRWMSHVLVVGEVALALILLIGAALMIRSFSALRNVDPGFDPGFGAGGALVLRIPLPDSKYEDTATWQRFHKDLLEQSAALPGVESTAVSSLLPLVSGSSETIVLAAGAPLPKTPEDALSTLYQTVSRDYFRTLGIELVQGRLFSKQDSAEAPYVAVIDEKMAHTLWPGENPLGQRLAFEFERRDILDPGPMYREVIGVVSHVRHYRLDEESRVEVYASLDQPNRNARGAPSLWFIARTTGDPLQLAAPVRQLVRDIDGDQPIFAVQSLEQAVSRHWARGQMISGILSAFSFVALILAAIGLYGVIAYAVRQRTHEFGIRMALGAGRGRVLRLVVRQGLMLSLMGIAIGITGALALTRLLSQQLFGVAATDPWLFTGLSLLLLAIATTAAFLPALRATRISPVAALRQS